jgi:Protein phosphatase 2C
VRVLLASEPSAVDRPNEDFAAVVPGAAVLLDGAGYVPDTNTGCVHGVAWYARTLGALLAAAANDTAIPLPELLSRGIEQVSLMHAGTCDLGHPDTPGATVIITRQRAGVLEYLVLCDSVLLLQPRQGEPRAVTDPQLGDITRQLRPSSDLPAGTPEHDAAWRAYAKQLEEARNQPGGFWLAAADPAAAGHAVTGHERLTGLSAVALLSDGASRLADRFQLATWAEICRTLADQGPAGLIRLLREAETSDACGQRWPRGKIHDDATAVYWQID